MELMVSAGGFGVGLAAAYGFGVFPARCGIVTQLGGDRVTSKCIKLASSFGFAVLIALIAICVLIKLKDLLALTSTAFGLAVGWATGILAAHTRVSNNDSSESEPSSRRSLVDSL